MELGGHAPVLVFEDAQLEAAINLSVSAKFRNAGQVCVAPSRFFVHESLVDEYSEGLVDRVNLLHVGPGTDPASTLGPALESTTVGLDRAFGRRCRPSGRRSADRRASAASARARILL